MSHLLQMRGLKPLRINGLFRVLVASFTDAWIETKEMRHQYQHLKVASFTDAWIETLTVSYSTIRMSCRIFYRCVD